MMALIGTPATRENEKKRMGYFAGFCFTTGLLISPRELANNGFGKELCDYGSSKTEKCLVFLKLSLF